MTDQVRQFYASLPRKRMAAGVLLFNERDELLIVKPTYRDGWLIPGGTVEAGESPLMACVRETHEEIGIACAMQRLLCIDYVSDDGERTESVHFIFDGGRLSPEQADALRLPADELSEYRFVTLEVSYQLLNARLARRVQHCMDALARNATLYLEDGEPA